MTWQAVVAALDVHEMFRSRISVYHHPLAGRPVLWHVISSALEVTPPPAEIRVLHRADDPIAIPDLPGNVAIESVPAGSELRALRAAVTRTGLTALVDGSAALLTSATIARMLRGASAGLEMLAAERDPSAALVVVGEGPALASADDPRLPAGATRVPPSVAGETVRVVDRHSLADATTVMRDRLIRRHEARGVTFLLPATTLVDVDVRIGADSVIYPGVVLEGATVIGSECVIGPHSRVTESSIGRGVELGGWNYVYRTTVRNHAVLEPFARRGHD